MSWRASGGRARRSLRSGGDLLPLARVGVECIAASRGELPQGSDPNSHIHRVMEHAPEDVRATVVRGMRAFMEFCEEHQGRRH